MYRIGELALRYQVKTDTLRFYDKQGLLTPSSRTESGYRIYSENDAEHLSFILRAKAIGFSLTEIAELLSIELDRANWACADVKGVVDNKLQHLRAQIDELNYFNNALQRLSDACCGGPESAENCSILEGLQSDSDSDSIICANRSQKKKQSHSIKNGQNKG
ncbi:MAG: MerR family Zn(II)-responsive transcriptional regulator of zntA [Psychromonas sp.]|jgi:MerR family Zn(II)-responsive transcriptional regulator of zntA|uniref:Zn(2+)-responsive transcriptional regulator n=1 Tax=Psychromonas sp. TaxID=1884585 RepID=UPI0039E219DF